MRGPVAVAVVVAVAGFAGCSKSTPKVVTTTTVAPTTSTTAAPVTQLTVDGVRPGVLQQPFYPQIMVTQVTCGTGPTGVPFVQIDLPPGGAGTPAGSVMTKATEVIVVPGTAVLVQPSYPGRVLYEESMASIAINQGVLVLSLVNPAPHALDSGGDGMTVVEGAVQVNGNFQCPG